MNVFWRGNSRTLPVLFQVEHTTRVGVKHKVTFLLTCPTGENPFFPILVDVIIALHAIGEMGLGQHVVMHAS